MVRSFPVGGDTEPAAPILADEEDEPPPETGRTSSGEPRHVNHSHGTRSAAARRVSFMRRHFPGVTRREWMDWTWQMAHRYRDPAGLSSLLDLTDAERGAMATGATPLPLSITPYYASLLDPSDPGQPLRRAVVPVRAELTRSPGEADDPLGEEDDMPVPGLVHRYPDRVLFLVTDRCPVYCRYCTRSRLVGGTRQAGRAGQYDSGHRPEGLRRRWETAIEYIRNRPHVRDVLISGGDPLMLPDDAIDWLLAQIRTIRHVEIIRIGTKTPAVLPMRITPALVAMIRRHHPVWMSLHATHPDEVTPDMRRACERLADAGIPLGSQTVLLAGINDSVDVLRELYHRLLSVRVRPYYLYQCDPIAGSAHFRTSVSAGLEMIRGLRGHTSGYAVPHYVVDAPGGGGKIPLLPNYVVGYEEGTMILQNYEGLRFAYPDAGMSNP